MIEQHIRYYEETCWW